MVERTSRPRDRILLAKTALLVMAGTLLLFGCTFAFLTWSSRTIDEASASRQIAVAKQVVDQLRYRIAHDQESVTVWRDAGDALDVAAASGNSTWVDARLGTWMVSHFGHDGSVVLSTADVPIYAMFKRRPTGIDGYEPLRPVVEPMVAQLRAQIKQHGPTGWSHRLLTDGVSDFRMVNGRPAVVSLKPFSSASDGMTQAAGDEYIHVAVRYLDSDFLRELPVDHRSAGLYFSPGVQASDTLLQLPLVAANGEALGYFVWWPYRPGQQYLASVMPGLMFIGGIIVATLALFVFQFYRRTMASRAQDAEIRYVVEHDGLTGLANRAAFERQLDEMLQPAASGEEPQLAVLYLDLDHFKQINDTKGHGTGDAVICEVARRITRLLPSGALLCRAGGDEFHIAMPYSSVAQVEAECAELVTAVQQPFDFDDHQFFIGISIGAALAPVDGTRRLELTRKADVALYSAKASGRGTFALFGPQMDAHILEQAEAERDLRSALDDKSQFEVFYQPKYAARSGEIASVEALVRWHHPSRGFMSPAVFIPISEQTGLIRELGRFVLEEACRDAVNWAIDNVAVNVSIVQLRDPFFAMTVISVLGATGLDPRKLELELTETVWADQPDECVRNIKALRDIGVRIALDDFGTGFSTFARLRVTQLDHLKIDKVFIDGLGKSGGDEAIVRAIVDLAKAKGLRTTAEGVETTAQRDFLVQVGCDELQGFLFSKPVPRADITRMLAEQKHRDRGLRSA